MFKTNINRLVVDIETLGINSNSPVLSIGAALLRSDQDEIEAFEWGINIDEYTNSDDIFVADQSTLDWWEAKEGSKEYKTAFNGKLSIVGACDNLRDFYIKNKCKEIWANHPHFDITILENLFKYCHTEIPWKYYEVFDTATLVKPFFPESMKKEYWKGLIPHIASHDAKYEAKCLQYLIPRLQLSDPIDILF